MTLDMWGLEEVCTQAVQSARKTWFAVRSPSSMIRLGQSEGGEGLTTHGDLHCCQWGEGRLNVTSHPCQPWANLKGERV